MAASRLLACRVQTAESSVKDEAIRVKPRDLSLIFMCNDFLEYVGSILTDFIAFVSYVNHGATYFFGVIDLT